MGNDCNVNKFEEENEIKTQNSEVGDHRAAKRLTERARPQKSTPARPKMLLELTARVTARRSQVFLFGERLPPPSSSGCA